MQSLKFRMDNQGDDNFPSPKHEYAKFLADYFNERYSDWKNYLLKSPLSVWEIEKEFNNLAVKNYPKREKMLMLMATLKCQK